MMRKKGAKDLTADRTAYEAGHYGSGGGRGLCPLPTRVITPGHGLLCYPEAMGFRAPRACRVTKRGAIDDICKCRGG